MPSTLTVKPSRKLATWKIPLAYIAATVIAGMIFPRVEHFLTPDFSSTMSVSAAMSIAASIASGMISLTGIIFSLTFVMVQFSATAYSPRLVLWVARDPVIYHALGIFSATFLYALIMLGWVDRGASGKVPMISSWLVLGLLLASMGIFIALIDRISMLQVNRMLIFTGDHGRKSIADLYAPIKVISPRADAEEYRKRGRQTEPGARTANLNSHPQMSPQPLI